MSRVETPMVDDGIEGTNLPNVDDFLYNISCLYFSCHIQETYHVSRTFFFR